MENLIVIVRNYHDMEIQELFPEVIKIKANQNPADVLRQIWEDDYNTLIAQEEYTEDYLDEDNCWFEEDCALIAFEDGDTKAFYVVEVNEKY